MCRRVTTEWTDEERQLFKDTALKNLLRLLRKWDDTIEGISVAMPNLMTTPERKTTTELTSGGRRIIAGLVLLSSVANLVKEAENANDNWKHSRYHPNQKRAWSGLGTNGDYPNAKGHQSDWD
jgi:hypothetical protein